MDNPTKICSRCKEELPLTAFHRSPSSKDGRHSFCAACYGKYRAEKRRQKHLANYDNWRVNAEGVICPTCGIRKPLSEYYKNRARPSGYATHCKVCASQRAKEDRRKNPVVHSERAKRYYEAHKSEILEKQKADVEGRRRRYRNHYIKHSERHNSRMQQHYRENKPLYKARAQVRRSIEKNAPGAHSKADIRKLYNEYHGRCAYCGITLHDDYHVDHILPLSRGGSNWPDNLCVACPDCNLSKRDKTVQEWKETRGW